MHLNWRGTVIQVGNFVSATWLGLNLIGSGCWIKCKGEAGGRLEVRQKLITASSVERNGLSIAGSKKRWITSHSFQWLFRDLTGKAVELGAWKGMCNCDIIAIMEIWLRKGQDGGLM